MQSFDQQVLDTVRHCLENVDNFSYRAVGLQLDLFTVEPFKLERYQEKFYSIIYHRPPHSRNVTLFDQQYYLPFPHEYLVAVFAASEQHPNYYKVTLSSNFLTFKKYYNLGERWSSILHYLPNHLSYRLCDGVGVNSQELGRDHMNTVLEYRLGRFISSNYNIDYLSDVVNYPAVQRITATYGGQSDLDHCVRMRNYIGLRSRYASLISNLHGVDDFWDRYTETNVGTFVQHSPIYVPTVSVKPNHHACIYTEVLEDEKLLWYRSKELISDYVPELVRKEKESYPIRT